jgi:Skp family chaperone for outer membrane proteins
MKLRNVILQIFSLTIAVMIGAALPLDAQTGSQSRVVVVDGERVTSETQVGKSVRDRVNNAVSQWESRLQAGQAELQTMAQNRQTQALTLSQDALAQLDRDIEEKQVELQRMQDDARRQIERLQNESQAEINKVLIPVLEQMASDQGYDMVFDSRMVQTGALLYFANSLDVTDGYISRVNAAAAGSN